MKSRLVAFIFLATMLVASAHATADCDADMITALKTNYQSAESGTLADLLYTLACERNVESAATNASGNAIGYGDASYGTSSTTIKEACAAKDRKFFQANSSAITYQMLPAEAFEFLRATCAPPRGLSLTPTVVGNQITLRIVWTNPDSLKESLKVRSFNAGGSVQCSNPPAEGALIKLLTPTEN